MAVEIRSAPLEGEPPLESPRNPAGEPFHYCMLYNSATLVAWADSATELCDLLIEGYLEIPEEDLEEQAAQRALYAVGAQVRLQAAILAAADPARATEAERAVLSGSRDVPPEVEVWESPIPLVLVDAFYAPFTDRRRPLSRPRGDGAPGSNLIWLEFADELSFLMSLSAAGEIQMATADYAGMAAKQ